MYIEKALKKQLAFKRILFITMIVLGISLPIITYLANIRSMFLYGYLLILELLILLAIIATINKYKLRYQYSCSRLKYKSGISFRENTILCDRIAIVHTDRTKDDMEIILISSIKFKSKYSKPIPKGFIQKYPEAGAEYVRLKKINPDTEYYFQVIRKGALKKYLLLELLFTTCVNAAYTASAIENIKIARNQKEI